MAAACVVGKALRMAQQQAPQHSETERQEEEQECENPDDLNNRRDSIDEKVGVTELESVTSCVSSRRSNQLSYTPGEAIGFRLSAFRLEQS